jgi:hypothetical protein
MSNMASKTQPKPPKSTPLAVRFVRALSSARAIAIVGCVIALASAGITFAMYKDTQRYNSFQMSQGDPVIMFEGFHADLHDGKSFTDVNSTTSKLCNRYYFTMSTANDHPITSVSVHSTTLQFPTQTDVKGYSYKDEFGDRTFAKDSNFSTSPVSICFYMYDEKNADFQGGSVYWHGTVSFTDALTNKQFTKELYQVLWMEYDKQNDNFESKIYLMTAKQFDADTKNAVIKELD